MPLKSAYYILYMEKKINSLDLEHIEKILITHSYQNAVILARKRQRDQ
jgi:hypothetical protein